MRRLIGAIALLLVLISLVGVIVLPGVAHTAPPETSNDYGWIKEEQVSVSLTGAAGAASGSATSGAHVRGHLYALHLDYAATISGTTDITITTASDPALTLLALTDYYTDTWYYPAVQQTGADGSGTSTYDRLPVNDRLTVQAAESTSATLVVTIYYGE